MSARVLVGHQDIYQPPDARQPDVGHQGYWTSRTTTVPFSEPVMMRVSSKHSRVQRVITGVCRTARSLCADGRMQGKAVGWGGWHGARAAGKRWQGTAEDSHPGVARGGRGWQGGGRAGVHQREQVPDPLPLTTYYLRLPTCHLRLTTYILLTTHCSLPATHQRAQVPYLDQGVEAARDHLRLRWGLANPNPLS